MRCVTRCCGLHPLWGKKALGQCAFASAHMSAPAWGPFSLHSLRPTVVTSHITESSGGAAVASWSGTLRYQRSFFGTLSLTPCLRQSWSKISVRRWMCVKEDCRAINEAVHTECKECGTPKPPLRRWKCVSCGTQNHSGVKRCKQCKQPFELSKAFWTCAACGENNRVDEIEDNSRCGFCGYDMAPLSVSEEDNLRVAHERYEQMRQQQEAFDGISAREAGEQFGNELAGADNLPDDVRRPLHASSTSLQRGAPRGGPKLPVSEVKPFAPRPVETSHSRLYRRPPSPTELTGVVPPGPPGFDWMCRESTCGHCNPGDEENCLQCGAHIAPANWECQACAAMNHLSRSRCFYCKTSIPAGWTCAACGVRTSIYDAACRGCGASRPEVAPKTMSELTQSTSPPRGPRRGMDWTCPSCDGLNFARRTECYQCGQPRPATAGHAPPPHHQSSAFSETVADDGFGDPRSTQQNNWICPTCQASNFRTRRTCWQCHSEAPAGAGGWAESNTAPRFEREGFQDAADSKPAEGQMNPWKKTDEWVCAKCFSRNFRVRNDCFKCGAPKSLAVAPRRSPIRKPVKL